MIAAAPVEPGFGGAGQPLTPAASMAGVEIQLKRTVVAFAGRVDGRCWVNTISR